MKATILTQADIMKRVAERHAAVVTGHDTGCRCAWCCQIRVRVKRYGRRIDAIATSMSTAGLLEGGK